MADVVEAGAVGADLGAVGHADLGAGGELEAVHVHEAVPRFVSILAEFGGESVAPGNGPFRMLPERLAGTSPVSRILPVQWIGGEPAFQELHNMAFLASGLRGLMPDSEDGELQGSIHDVWLMIPTRLPSEAEAMGLQMPWDPSNEILEPRNPRPLTFVFEAEDRREAYSSIPILETLNTAIANFERYIYTDISINHNTLGSVQFLGIQDYSSLASAGTVDLCVDVHFGPQEGELNLTARILAAFGRGCTVVTLQGVTRERILVLAGIPQNEAPNDISGVLARLASNRGGRSSQWNERLSVWRYIILHAERNT